jgi:UDP-MurNAc hydroxylase
MCIIDNGNEVLVNTNDCPYDLSYQAASIIKQKYSRIDMLLVGYTSASAYPQCFVLSDSEKLREKKRLQQDFLKKAENYVNLFEPKYFMPFAGRYTLTGKLTKLNNFRGVTELDDAFEYFINSEQINSTKSKCIILNPNTSFNTLIGESSEPYVKINNAEKEKYIEDILFKRKLDYEYENQPKTDEIKSFIEKSYQRFERKRVGLRFSSDTTILIKLSDTEYIAISCNGSGWKIINENQLKDYLKFVKLSLDVKLLKWILMGPKFGH